MIKIVSSNQESLSEKLMNEIREVMLKPEYDRMYISTLIGILEMLKIESYRRLEG